MSIQREIRYTERYDEHLRKKDTKKNDNSNTLYDFELVKKLITFVKDVEEWKGEKKPKWMFIYKALR